MNHEALKILQAHIQGAFPEDTLIDARIKAGGLRIRLARHALQKVILFLRDDPQCRFSQLIDVTAVDYPENTERFELVYQLLSVSRNQRVTVKVTTDEAHAVASLSAIYPNSPWYEREVWDMFGIVFDEHPDLRRILTDYGFEGHPLRKDFPLSGYVELRYDPTQGRVVYEPVKLTQDYRYFDTLSPWQGMTDVQLPGDEKAVKPLGASHAK